MKAIIFIASSFIAAIGFSQMNSFDADPAELVYDILQGQSISISNVTFQGHPRQIGYFDGTIVNIPFQYGVILSTGFVNGYGPWGPNDSIHASGWLELPGDFELQLLHSNESDHTYDAAILEFDFIPLGDSLKLKLLFASEEYGANTFPTSYNDGIGIFLLGPSGITSNIAKIQNQAISVNTINSIMNQPLYIYNGNGSQSPYNVNNSYCRYDGLTRPINISAYVTPNQTHHLRIGICDKKDQSYDSALFLEAHSMTAGLNEDFDSNLLLLPNPVTDILTIESSTENLTVHLLDLNGKQLFSKEITGLSGTIDLTPFQSGTYLVKIFSSTSSVTKKIVKL